MPTNAPLNRKLRMGLIGGGQGAFIGRVHATAAVLDNRAALVAGALSSDPAKAKASAPDYDIPADRAYASLQGDGRGRGEAGRTRSISSPSPRPNHTHFEIAKTFAEAGFNVICDKPMTFDLAQAEELLKVVEKTRRRVRRHAQLHRLPARPPGPRDGAQRRTRARSTPSAPTTSRAGSAPGWSRSDQKQAKWRTDPKQSGAAGCFGDIGTHAYNLGRYITGLLPKEISCLLKVFEPGRALDDYGVAAVRFENGALGTVTASQISHGRENDLFIEVDGTKAVAGVAPGGAEQADRAEERRAAQGLHPQRRRRTSGRPPRPASRLPAGHPEAFFEAFANVYAARLRRDGEAGRRREVRDGEHGLPERLRRRRGDAVHHPVRREQQGRTGTWLPFRHPKSRQ